MTALMLFVVLHMAIGLHEYGHYRMARHLGMHVDTVCSGFGPKLLHYTDRRGTAWQLRLLPFGGYAAPHMTDRPLGQQALVLLAGPGINLLAFLGLGLLMFGFDHGLAGAFSLMWQMAYDVMGKIFSILLEPLTLDYWHKMFTIGNMLSLHDNVAQLVTVTSWWVMALRLLLVVNLVLLVNLLPVPPLDGGRLLLLAAEQVFGVQRSSRFGGAAIIAGTIYIMLWMGGLVLADLWVLGQRLF